MLWLAGLAAAGAARSLRKKLRLRSYNCCCRWLRARAVTCLTCACKQPQQSARGYSTPAAQLLQPGRSQSRSAIVAARAWRALAQHTCWSTTTRIDTRAAHLLQHYRPHPRSALVAARLACARTEQPCRSAAEVDTLTAQLLQPRRSQSRSALVVERACRALARSNRTCLPWAVILAQHGCFSAGSITCCSLACSLTCRLRVCRLRALARCCEVPSPDALSRSTCSSSRRATLPECRCGKSVIGRI